MHGCGCVHACTLQHPGVAGYSKPSRAVCPLAPPGHHAGEVEGRVPCSLPGASSTYSPLLSLSSM
eukprot:scaffold4437_cov115-Isochrysis_galbana.AAC.2